MAPEQVFGQLLAGFLACEASAYLVGVNLVGQENGAVALRDYWLHMHMVRWVGAWAGASAQLPTLGLEVKRA